MSGRFPVGLVAGVLALTASACGQSSGGQAAPNHTSPPSQPGASDHAPRVQHPKNLKAVTDACRLLTPEQLAKLGAGDAQPKADDSVFGESRCNWQSDNFGVIVGGDTSTGHGAHDIGSNTDELSNFTPIRVAGYPAGQGGSTSRLCSLNVGVAQRQLLRVDYARLGGDSPAMRDTCGYAKKIAVEVLKNIPDA